MNDEQVAHYLIEKGYHLTALELFTEGYERNGVAIEELSAFFEDSANFLMFEDMRSVSEISTGSSEPVNLSNDAMRIKDDRIAVLEHEIKVLHDSLDEAQSQLQNKQENITVQSPPTNFVGPAQDSEDLVLNGLISKYMSSRGYKLSALAFNNETSNAKQGERVKLPDDVDLTHLLRSYQFVQHSPQMAEEIDALRAERQQQRDAISQLQEEIENYKKQIKDFELKLSEKKEEPAEVPQQPEGDNEKPEEGEKGEETNDEQKDQEAAKTEAATPQAPQPVIEQEPPSVQLLDDIWTQIPGLIKNNKDENVITILTFVSSIYKYHPDRKVRIECASTILESLPNPTSDQITRLVKILTDTKPDENRVATEILPLASGYLASASPGILCLVSRLVSELAPYASMDIRTSFMLSIVKQLAENTSPQVRAAVVKDSAKLIELFDSSAQDKFEELMPLLKSFIFDQDGTVQSLALDEFAPALLKLIKDTGEIGTSYIAFWLKLAFSFGLTGSSSLATVRFKLCVRALELALPYIVPTSPTPEQTIVPSDQLPLTAEVVPVRKEELDYAINTLVPQLPDFSPLLFVQIGIKKDADSIVAQICRTFGTQFSNEHILPAFSKLIEEGEGEKKLQAVTLFISAVVPYCGNEAFFAQSRNFLTYSTNELRGFKSRDIQDYIAPAFSLMTSRDSSIRPLVFQLLDELSRSSRAAIRTSALNVLSEVLPTLEQQEIATSALPIVSRLAEDPDETLLLEVVNCVGAIARFSTVLDVMKTVRSLFDKWFEGKIPIRLQALRVFAFIVGDVEPQFRDDYLIPKMFQCANETVTWEEAGSREQAMTLILHIFGSIEDFPEDKVQSIAIPLISDLEGCDITANDPKLQTLKKKFMPKNDKDNKQIRLIPFGY